MARGPSAPWAGQRKRASTPQGPACWQDHSRANAPPTLGAPGQHQRGQKWLSNSGLLGPSNCPGGSGGAARFRQA
eukprot:653765-Lingulodinium_polyedra.AAC.1